MKESFHGCLQTGLVYGMAFPDAAKSGDELLGSLERIVRDEFFTVIEIGWGAPLGDGLRERVGALLEAGQMQVIFAAQSRILENRLDLNAEDEATRRRAVASIKEAVDEAYDLKAGRLALMSGKDPGADHREAARMLLAESIKEICRYAEVKGAMNILLENFDREVDKCSLMGPTEEAVSLAREIRRDCPNFGLALDQGHLPLLGETPRQALGAAKDYLVHVHLGNCVLKEKDHPAYGDRHPRFGIRGGENGLAELVEFLEALREVGYLLPGSGKRPTASFEVKPLPGESSEAVLAGAKRTLLGAWAVL